VKQFRLLSSDELDLQDFLEDLIESLQLVVEEHDTAAPFVAQDALTLVQDPSPCSSVLPLSAFAQASASSPCVPSLSGTAGRWSIVVVVLPCLRSLGVAQIHPVLQRYHFSIHAASHRHAPLLWLLPTVAALVMFIPKSQFEVCISCSGLVAGCYFVSVGCDEAALCCSLRPHLEVVKSVKTKPHEVVSLVLPSSSCE
jgi:hypothetical protein